MTKKLIAERKKLQLRIQEINDLEIKEKTEVHVPAMKAKYEQTYWKCMNSYGDGRGEWALYAYIDKVENVCAVSEKEVSSSFSGWKFQSTRDGTREAKIDNYFYLTPGWVQITKEEFTAAFTSFCSEINKLPGL